VAGIPDEFAERVIAGARRAGVVRGPVVHSSAVAEPTTERRWKTFADVVAFTLGTNVWISIVILPAVFVGALPSRRLAIAAALPFLVLMLGLARRSEAVLLGLFPAAVLVPVALHPQMASSYVYGPIRFTLVAIGVVAYLFGVSFFTTWHEPPAPRSIRGLTSAQVGPAARWQRRERVYWMLTGMSLVIPTVLIAWVNFDSAIEDYLGEMYPGRVALMTTALTVGAIVLWLGIYHYAFLGVLRPHRTGDRDLVTTLAQARADAKSGKPRPRFYLSVALALAAMATLILLRHLKG
jgi:hypothetical protein